MNNRKEPSMIEFISFVVFFVLGVITAIIYKDELLEIVIDMLSAKQ